MDKKFAYLLSLALLIIIMFLPSRFSKDTLTDNPKLNIRKRISKIILDKPKPEKGKKTFRPVSDIPKKEDQTGKVITSSLQKEIDEYINLGKKDIRIVLNTADDTGDLADRIESYGGQILRKRPNFVALEIPVDKVNQLIRESSSIEYARLPFKFFPSGEVTEGVALTGASIFHDTIYKGAGVKVAVLDVGFKGLTEAIAAGELPADVITHDFSSNGLETEYYHGTACAEIVHDMAPDAELHLLKMGDEIAGYEVIDYCIKNDIDIVSLSIGTFGSGPGDGTGPLDEAFDELRDAGILVVASAGNYGNSSYEIEGVTLTFGSHWEGTFADNDGDTYHEYNSYYVNSYYNVIGAYPSWNDDNEPRTSEVSILMRWNDWPVSNIDYDMYLYEYDYETQEIGELVASSETYQTGTQPPVEYISMDIPDDATDGRFFALMVTRLDSGTPTGTDFEIYLGGTSEFYPFRDISEVFHSSALATSESSIAEPADAESVLAVGAIDYMNWTTGPQEEFSSQGPTNDWNGSTERIKPDIMGPDRVTTYTYGDSAFPGTSAAAPHVAGIAALLLSKDTGMSPEELQVIIEVDAIDINSNGKNNIYGWGKINAVLQRFVESYIKISGTEGNFTGLLDYSDGFGSSIASIGDLNGDAIEDLAVGASGDDDGVYGGGALWILFLNSDGSVKSHQKISATEGYFTGILNQSDHFGKSLTSIGDLDGDGITDLAAGITGTDNSLWAPGAIWILFMNSDGTVKSNQR